MARQTSIDCYNQIKAEGLLSKRRLQIYEVFLENGALTGTEVAVLFKKKHLVTSHSEGIRNRITELFNMGVVYEKGTKVCSITSKTVVEWDLTDNLPKDLPKKKTKSQKKKELLELVGSLGGRILDEQKDEMREIYKKVKNL